MICPAPRHVPRAAPDPQPEETGPDRAPAVRPRPLPSLWGRPRDTELPRATCLEGLPSSLGAAARRLRPVVRESSGLRGCGAPLGGSPVLGGPAAPVPAPANGQ